MISTTFFLFAIVFNLAISQLQIPQQQIANYNPDVFGPLSSLRDASIRELIELRPEQIASIEKLDSLWKERFAVISQHEESRNKIKAVLKDVEGQALNVLSAGQADRLRRLRKITFFEIRYFRLLRRCDIQCDLKLTNDQLAIIESVYKQWLVFAEDQVGKQTLDQISPAELLNLLAEKREVWENRVRKDLRLSLSENQKVREEQIELQDRVIQSGPKVFLVEEIHRSLNIDKRTGEKIDELAKAFTELRTIEQVRAMPEAYNQVITTLTMPQQMKWESMLGPSSPGESWLNSKRDGETNGETNGDGETGTGPVLDKK